MSKNECLRCAKYIIIIRLPVFRPWSSLETCNTVYSFLSCLFWDLSLYLNIFTVNIIIMHNSYPTEDAYSSGHLALSHLGLAFLLYARLQTGRIMVWWYPSVRVSVRPSVRPSQFSALFSYMLWDIELKFCVVLYFDAHKIKFKCHKFPSIFAGVMPLLNFKFLQICSFPHFSPTCFDILSWNFVYDFVLLYYR